MRGTLVLARREIVEKRNTLVAAAVAGLIPLLIPLIPPFSGGDNAAFREGAALFLLFALGWGTAFLLGASMLARDLSERRLGFYFSRPLSAGAIWGGKLLGAWVLTGATLALVFLPASFVNGSLLTSEGGGFLLLAATGALLIVPLAHAAAVATRSRSPWIAVDFACLSGAVLLIGAGVRLLLDELLIPSFATVAWFAALLTVALLLILVTAGALQVSRGRTDLRLGHRILSIALWTPLLVLSLGVFGFGLWFANDSPDDLAGPRDGSSAPSGPWVTIAGHTRGRGDFPRTFLLDSRTGAWLRLGPAGWQVEISEDGRRSAWLRTRLGRGEMELFTANLSTAHPTPVPLMRVSAQGVPLALSPDGGRLAFVDQGLLTVLDIDSRRTLASALVPLPRNERLRLVFAGRDRIRVYGLPVSSARAESKTIEIVELDIRSRRIEATGRIDLPGPKWVQLHPEARASRLLVLAGPHTASLREGRSGALLANLVDDPGRTVTSAAFLADGGVAVAVKTAAGNRLLVFGSGLTLQREIPLEDGRWIRAGREAVAGRLLVAVKRAGAGQSGWSSGWNLFLVDLVSGGVEPKASGLYPLDASEWFSGSSFPPAQPGAEGSRLFLDEAGSLVRFDAVTGEKRTLLEGR